MRKLLGVVALGLLVAAQAQNTVDAQVTDLLSKLTLEEKIGQMTQIDVLRMMGDPNNEWDRGPLDPNWMKIVLEDNHVGSILSGGGNAPVPNTPRAWADMTAQIQKYALEHSSQKVPLIYGVDAVHGHNNVMGATMYPHNIGLAATGDPTLVQQIGKQTAEAVRATGTPWNFAPVADLGRDPRWGRFFETFGEDPVLVSSLVAAYVRGGLEGKGIVTVKHFLGYGSAESGQDRGNATIGERDLRLYYLPPYKAGIDAGAQTVMVNSGSLNGEPGHASRKILTDLLRGQLGFKGLTISDWEDVLKLQTVHHVAANYKDAIALAVNAGVDMAMIPHDAATFTRLLRELVQEKRVPTSRIDEAVGRILRVKITAGLFDHPTVTGTLEALKNPGLAERAALESMTLLSNNGVLPFAETTKRFVVAGDSLESVANLLGGWSIGWQGIGNETVPGVQTVLEGLKGTAPKGSSFELASNATDLTKRAATGDAIILVVGEPPYAEGKGDNPAPALNRAQVDLLHAANRSGKPVAVVLVAGRPLLLPEPVRGALLFAGLPGSNGASAIAKTLFGVNNPGGRLPFSYPASLEQIPLAYNAKLGAVYKPLYAFGAGLSFTSFTAEGLEVAQSGETVTVSVQIKNTGKRAGDKIVQVYGTKDELRQLAAIGRISLEPGASQKLTLSFPKTNLATISSDAAGAFRAGTVTVNVEGPSQILELK